MSGMNVLLTGDPLDIAALHRLASTSPDCGAVASFTGQVRSGSGLDALELQHHPVLTQQALERIAADAGARFGAKQLVLAHRYGRMDVGQPIVFIACACAHRRDALDAVSYMIDLTKTRAPFWKREWRGGEARWIEPTAADQAAARQWMETRV